MKRAFRSASSQRGLTLLEALIALLVMAVGMLGAVGLHMRMMSATTDAQYRVQATALVDRLLSYAVVDVANAACYAAPHATTCTDAAAANALAQWRLDVAALPQHAASAALVTVPGSTFAGSNQQLRVRVQWQGKLDAEPHWVEATTDVR
jgi:type IV pilus assembly protein PilV